MKVISVNTGTPKSYTLGDTTMKTSMVRTPQERIEVKFEQVVGDQFTSPNIHGVREAVVYALSADRYEYWSEFLKHPAPIGLWGENLTIDKLREEDFYLGDEYEVGTALLKVTGPRYPCTRLDFVAGVKDMRVKFADQAWPGIYFQVLREGVVQAGDELVLKKRVQEDVHVTDLFLTLRDCERREPISERVQRVYACPQLLEKYRVKIKRVYADV